MVHQRSPISRGSVAPRFVEKKTVEEKHASLLDLKRDRPTGRDVECDLADAVVFVIVGLAARLVKGVAVASRHHPKASVLYRRVVNRHPRACEASILCWDVSLVLMPRLPRKAWRLDEQHALHAFHVGTDQATQGPDDSWMRKETLHDRAQFVRLMDAKVFAQAFILGRGFAERHDALDRVLSPEDLSRLATKDFDVFVRYRLRQRKVSVLTIELDLRRG